MNVVSLDDARRSRRASGGGPFDVERHRREKLHRLERENEHLRRHREQLERWVAILLRVATGGTAVPALELLAVVEQFDALEQESPFERGLRVLRETAP